MPAVQTASANDKMPIRQHAFACIAFLPLALRPMRPRAEQRRYAAACRSTS
jgi:hypothetical protein